MLKVKDIIREIEALAPPRWRKAGTMLDCWSATVTSGSPLSLCVWT